MEERRFEQAEMVHRKHPRAPMNAQSEVTLLECPNCLQEDPDAWVKDK